MAAGPQYIALAWTAQKMSLPVLHVLVVRETTCHMALSFGVILILVRVFLKFKKE
jgi:hypothetical protein